MVHFEDTFWRELFYKHYYKKYSVTANSDNIFARFFHSKIETFPNKDFLPITYPAILEVGAGEGEHTKFVKNDEYLSYTLCDIREIVRTPSLEKFDIVIANAENLPFNDDSFDRVLMTCLLHHVSSPLKVLNEVRRVVKGRQDSNQTHRGLVTIALPCDPGFMYRTAKLAFSISGNLSKEDKMEFEFLSALEHRNHYLSLRRMILYTFKDNLIFENHYPFRFKSYHLNAFTVFQIYL